MKPKSTEKTFSSVREANETIAPLRSMGKILVTTNGCFDLLHVGHVRCLREAAALGDILAVGINSDDVVRKLKGEGRPLQKAQERLEIVAALEMVDCAFIFTEDDPRAFLEVLRPDVHVKGGDYPQHIIEKPVVEKYGGVVRIVTLVEGYSTSSIVKKSSRAAR
jgi:rfaE bifunctional protein nucleotidyltransferase chain/domain